MKLVSLTLKEWEEVKYCLENALTIKPKRWALACDKLKIFWDDNGRHRGKPVDLEVLYEFVSAYYAVCDYYDYENHDECHLLHPLQIHHYIADLDDYGISAEDMKEFAYMCLELNAWCIYFFPFLSNDVKAAKMVLEWDECDCIKDFNSVEDVFYDIRCEDHEDLDDDDLLSPLLHFEELLCNKSFVLGLIERKYDVGGCIPYFLYRANRADKKSPLFNVGTIDKWYECQKNLIEDNFSDMASEDGEILQRNYNYYRILCDPS